MKKLYPLKFRSEWKDKAWGGESWEICGFEGEASVVEEGFLAGNDLADILETYLGDLTGEKIFDWYNVNFPLLIKRLDIRGLLSVQVHPDDEIAAELYDSYGKSEFWYVEEAGPDARIYMGFKEDCDAATLYEACRTGNAHKLLNVFVPKQGDCFFIPAGTVHAAGGELRIAEIQEASDITFRLYDWGRELNPETRREMHLEQALDCIDYRRYDENACSCNLSGDDAVRVIVNAPQFIISSIPLNSPARVKMEEFNSCIVYICTRGKASFEADGQIWELRAGETMLIPAALEEVLISPSAEDTRLLQAHIPQPPQEDVYDGPEPEV